MELPMFFFSLAFTKFLVISNKHEEKPDGLIDKLISSHRYNVNNRYRFFNLYFEWIYYLNCSFLFSVKLVAIGDMSDHVQILVLACATLVSVIRIVDHHLAY